MKHAGEIVKNRLSELRMGQKELGSKIGMNPSQVSRLIRGGTVAMNTWEKVCRELKIDPGIIFECEQEEKKEDSEPVCRTWGSLKNVPLEQSDLVRYLCSLLDEKERLIAEKDRLIQVLLSRGKFGTPEFECQIKND